MKFDIIIGNPPYQEDTKDTSDNPIYHLFMETAYLLSDKVCLITPGRFLFKAGKTPKKWQSKMLKDPHLKVMYYEQISGKVFPNTDIKGGVAITYRDKEKHFGTIETFTIFSELNRILQAVIRRGNFIGLPEIMYNQSKFNLLELYADYPHLRDKVGSKGKEKRLTTSIFTQLEEVFNVENIENKVDILGLIDNKRFYKCIDRKYLEKHANLDKYKVFVPKSNGNGVLGEVLSAPLIGEPLIGATQSFISIGAFETQLEAENAMKYIKTKFVRVMLGVLKITQDNPIEKWKYVPLQDFTTNSDIDWTQSIAEIDQQLYRKYKLSPEEIAFIEEKVKAMD